MASVTLTVNSQHYLGNEQALRRVLFDHRHDQVADCHLQCQHLQSVVSHHHIVIFFRSVIQKQRQPAIFLILFMWHRIYFD